MKKASFSIRKGTLKDLDQIADWQMAMALETENLQLDRKTLEQGIRNLFDRPELGTYWIMESQKKAIGCTLTLGEWSDWRNGTVLWIHSVYVDRAFRGKGAFQAMYEYLKKMVLRSKALKGLRLYVDKRNYVAQEVYKKVGMNGEHYQLFEWLQED